MRFFRVPSRRPASDGRADIGPSGALRGSPLRADDDGTLRLPGPACDALFRSILSENRPARFRAAGWSMAPAIRDGDFLIVAPLSGPPRLGAVVVFRPPGSDAVLVHRLIGRSAGRFRFKGDNTRHIDPPVAAEDMLGIVVGAERAGRTVRFAGGAAGRFAALASRMGMISAAQVLFWKLSRKSLK